MVNHLPRVTGEDHHSAKLTAKQVAEIKGLYLYAKERGLIYSRRDIAAQYKVHVATIGDILLGKLWKDVQPKKITRAKSRAA